MKMLFTFGVSGYVFSVKGSYFIIYKKISKQFDCNGCNLKSYFQYFLGTLTSSPSAKKRAGWPTKPYFWTRSKYHRKIPWLLRDGWFLHEIWSTDEFYCKSSISTDVLTKRKRKKYGYITLLVETLLKQQNRLV